MRIRQVWQRMFLLASMLLAAMAGAASAAAATEWTWISSDAKYSKYYAPSQILVVKRAELSGGRTVATDIQAMVKTTYSYGGAQETIQNFDMQKSVTNPAVLSYSVALVHINPQNRMMKYDREDFCDEYGNVLWTYDQAKEKEINSQQSCNLLESI